MSLWATDIWKVGVARAPMRDIAAAGTLAPFPVRWLPEEGAMRFLADPFGLWKDGLLHIFAEQYDYRRRKGVIKVFVLDSALDVIEQRIVLSEPWHLSYPFLIEEAGDIWMLPEAYRSGRLTLYRAVEFPWRWKAEPRLRVFPCAAIDASPVRIGGEWRMFYTPPFPAGERQTALRLAASASLFGPWEEIPAPFAKTGATPGRMGGTPLVTEDRLILPTQDCARTYGGALRLVSTALPLSTPPAFTRGPRLVPPPGYAPFVNGLHTLSAAGDVTLFDVKRISRNAPLRLAAGLRNLTATRV